VKVRIRAMGICGSELSAYKGAFPFGTYPRSLGHEVAGEVVELSDNSGDLSIGDRVVLEPYRYCSSCYPCSIGRTNCCENLKVIGFHANGAYMEYYGNNNSRISILQAEDAIKNCVEFGTLSKSYNMTGWRIGYIAGNREVIEKLMIVKTNFDSGQFAAIQNAGITALKNGDDFIDVMRSEYNFRRSMVIDTLINKGIHVYRSEGAFYVWFRVPKGYTSQEFTAFLLEKAGIIITPGDTFGTNGEGYCRISLTVNKNEIEAAMKRIEALNF
jgi:hypothetical protein